MEFKNISISDLAWELVPYFGKKAEERRIVDILREDRFVKPSKISQRDFAKVETYFYDYLSDIEFIELSPLQPLGLNCVLAGTNGKKLIPTIRGQEVNSDATAALFLEAFKRYRNDNIRLATHMRTTRPKLFSKESGFLPHFKVFAEVSIGMQVSPFGKIEVEGIARHLRDELNILQAIRSGERNQISHFNVFISNLVFLRNIAKLDSGHTMKAAEKAWRESGLPRYLSMNDDLIATLRSLKFDRGIRILEMFIEEIREWDDMPDVRFTFDLSRVAGINYYKHVAYKITAVHKSGPELPLADGGSNDWGAKMSQNKQIYTISSGIGTELLIGNYL